MNTQAKRPKVGGGLRSAPWPVVRVKDIANSIQYGHTASAVDRPNGPRFLRITDIQDGRVAWESVPSCDIPIEDIPKYRLAAGDLVFARTGATTGKSFLIGQCPESVFASYLIRVRVNPDIDPRYLAAFFQSPDYWAQIEGGKRGIGQPNVNGTTLGEVRLPLPPLDEQRRIVAEIEKQFTRLDAGVAALKRTQGNLKRYRAAVLKAACEGRLVPTEAELANSGSRKTKFETGEELLARILAKRRGDWQGRGKYNEPAPPDITNLSQLPDGWTWAGLGQLLGAMRNGISAKPDADDGLPILRISAVRALSVNFSEIRYLTATAADYPEYMLRGGDILFTRYNGNPDLVGVCGVVPSLTSPLVYPDKLIRCTPVAAIAQPAFIAMMANVGESRAYLAKRVRTTAGQAGISGGDLKGLPIPLPPLAEQARIVAEVERRLSIVADLNIGFDGYIGIFSHIRLSQCAVVMIHYSVIWQERWAQRDRNNIQQRRFSNVVSTCQNRDTPIKTDLKWFKEWANFVCSDSADVHL